MTIQRKRETVDSTPFFWLKMKLLVALWALAGTVSALLPVIVPLNDDANGTQWGPVTADNVIAEK